MLKGYKTVLFNLAVAGLYLLEKFDITQFTHFIPDQYEPLIVATIAFVNVLLRFVTTSPVFKK